MISLCFVSLYFFSEFFCVFSFSLPSLCVKSRSFPGSQSTAKQNKTQTKHANTPTSPARSALISSGRVDAAWVDKCSLYSATFFHNAPSMHPLLTKLLLVTRKCLQKALEVEDQRRTLSFEVCHPPFASAFFSLFFWMEDERKKNARIYIDVRNNGSGLCEEKI